MPKRSLTSKEIKETLKNGRYLYKHDKYELAYDQFEKILNSKQSYIHSKTYAKAMFGVGMIFKDRKRFREAKTCFKKAHEKNPLKIVYMREYGEACKEMKWYSEAIVGWEKCLRLQKNDIQLLTKIAECYNLLGNFVMAKKYYNKAYEIESKNKYVLLGLGNLYFHNHIYMDAIYYWEKLIGMGNQYTDVEILSKLGHCYRKREEYKKAVECYQKAFSLDEKNIYTLSGLARTYRELGDKEQELIFYEKLSSIEPDYKDIMVLLAGYYKKDKKYEKVIRYYEETVKKVNPFAALFKIALKEKEKGNISGCVEILTFVFYNSKIEKKLKEKIYKELTIINSKMLV